MTDNVQLPENPDTPHKINDLRRKLKHGSYSVVITVVFITIAILLNVVFSMLFGSLNLHFDLTERGLYSIEASTAEYLAALDDTINIYFCSTEENFTGRGIEFVQAHEIAKRFYEAGRSITVTFVDRLTN
ncbi:MAG: GldG family protein, partial [Oscillospiraceae bacterium]|nr:GldG family protein [Oscillospiraceae bacterium]